MVDHSPLPPSTLPPPHCCIALSEGLASPALLPHALQPSGPQGPSAGGEHPCAEPGWAGGSAPIKLPCQYALQVAGASGAKIAIAAAQGLAQGFVSSIMVRCTLIPGLCFSCSGPSFRSERRWCKGKGAGSISGYFDLFRSTCWQYPTQNVCRAVAKDRVRLGFLSLVEFAQCSHCEPPLSLWSNEGGRVVLDKVGDTRNQVSESSGQGVKPVPGAHLAAAGETAAGGQQRAHPFRWGNRLRGEQQEPCSSCGSRWLFLGALQSRLETQVPPGHQLPGSGS